MLWREAREVFPPEDCILCPEKDVDPTRGIPRVGWERDTADCIGHQSVTGSWTQHRAAQNRSPKLL